MILLTLFLFSICFSTIYNGREYKNVIISMIYIFIFCLFSELGVRHNAKLYLESMFKALSILVIVNFILLLIYPNGLYQTEYYHNEFHFLATKNGFIAYILPTIVAGQICKKLKSSVSSKYITLVELISIITIFITGSSTSIVGLLMFILLIILLKKHTLGTFINYKSLFITYIFFSFGITVFRIQNIFSFFIETILNKSLNFTGRTDIWDVAIGMIKNAFIIGNGADFNTGILQIGNTYYYSHNMLLEILVIGGVVALSLFLIITYRVGKQLKLRQSSISYILVAGICSFFIMSITESYILANGFYLFLILSVNIKNFEKYIQKE
jgi:Lipid A core - O-antigen ligase and related enzymes